MNWPALSRRTLTSNGFGWIVVDTTTCQLIAFHVRDRSRTSTDRVAKSVLIGAVSPLMLKTAANSGALSIAVCEDFRSAFLADRSQWQAGGAPCPSDAAQKIQS
jgi:hypothetical protein